MKDPTLFALGDKRGPLPLMVGVSGHRDLRADDRASLRKCLSGIFRQLKRHYPHTPIVLLSALAEGADCLAAEVALPLGIRLLVPLPMPADEYRTDFKTAESQQEFDHLMQQAEHVFEVGFAEGNTLERIRASVDQRALQYAQAGKFIVRHSQVLIALWDGHDSDTVGRTAQVVKLFQKPHLLQPAGFDLEKPRVAQGALCHVVTPHKSQPSPRGEPLTWNHSYLQTHQRGFSQLNRFNKDAVWCLSAGSFVRSRDDLIPFHELSVLPAPLQQTAACLRECYAVADALALHHQRWHNRFHLSLLVGTMLAAFLFQLYFKKPEVAWAKTLHGIFYSGIVGLWLFMYWKSFDVKHTTYRALAEGMRVFFFWRLAGLDPGWASESLRWLPGDLPWVPPALRTWLLLAERESATPGTGLTPATIASLARRDLVISYWVEKQRAYFKGKIDRLQRSNRRLFWLQFFFFLVGIPCCVLWVLANYTSLLPEEWAWLKDAARFGPVLGPLLNVVNVFAAFFLITLGVYFYKAGHNAKEKRVLKEFRNMKEIFDEAYPVLSKGSSQDQATHLQKLGARALQENGDWVQLYISLPEEDVAADG